MREEFEYETEFETDFDNGPDSGVLDTQIDSGVFERVNLKALEARATEGRKKAARVFQIFPGNGERALKAHADPFDTAIEAEVA